MNRALIAFIVLALASLACGSSAPKSVDDYLKEYGGNRDVYEKLFSMTDCTSLQNEFDIASENNQAATPGTPQFKQTTGYMVAADQRMKELDCYSASSQIQQGPSSTVTVRAAPIASATTYFLPTLTKPATSVVALPSATQTFIFIVFTSTAGSSLSGPCSCSGDTLNCSDFSTQSSAQACMDHCISIGAGDIHNLDGNANGTACESL
jgi:hypothetical protein